MIEELAKRYAYELMTCPDSTEDIDSVLESWSDNKHHKGAIVWHRFEDCDPLDLIENFYHLRNTFLDFAKKIREKG